MPVFGGGTSLFQPVYVGDIAKAVEIVSRDDTGIRGLVDGKVIEAGGPDGELIQFNGLTFLILTLLHH